MKNYEFDFEKNGVCGTIVIPATCFYDAVHMYNMVFTTVKIIRIKCLDEESPILVYSG